MFFKQLHFVIILVFGSLIFNSCKEDKKTIKQAEVTFKKEGTLTIFKSDSTQISLDIEIADTDFDIQTGLMYRNFMETKQGILFVFEDEQPRSFYMKNTKIPLDIIFISANKKIVSFQENAKPFNEASLPSNVPAKYVLEINASLVNTWNLKIGDRLSF